MVPFQNPSIYVNGLQIDEPITVLTDFVFAAVCFYAFIKTKNRSKKPAVNLYRWFFLLTGVSTTIAAIIGHAFLYKFGFSAKIYGWVFAVLSVSFAQFAALFHAKNSYTKTLFKPLLVFCSIETLAAFIFTFKYWSFVVVEVHTAIGLVLIVTSLEYIHYKKTKSKLSLYMMYGVGVAVIAVICHIAKFAMSVWFNHIDLSHLFMATSMYVMYLAIKNHDVNTTTPSEVLISK